MKRRGGKKEKIQPLLTMTLTFSCLFLFPTCLKGKVLYSVCLQPAVQYDELTMAGNRMIQAGYWLLGLCYSDGYLYAGEGRRVAPVTYSYSLAVYRVDYESGDIILLNRLELMSSVTPQCPRVEHHSQQVFVPCRESGVTVARLDGNRLVRERTLTCVSKAVSVGVMSPDTVYVCDEDTSSVCVVDVRDDRITSTLERLDTVKGEWPRSVAVLSDSVMVGYTLDGPLVMYHHGSPAPVRVIHRLAGLQNVTSISTFQHHFLVTDWKTKCVFVIDVNGKLHHTVKISTDTTDIRDCTAVHRQLWVGCGQSEDGDVVIMSS